VARVTLVGPVKIGDRVLIHPGAVLGADGFAFKPTRAGLAKIPQVGTVVVEDDVEIGANTTIDRAFLYETRIGRGSKLDNLVHVAHNVQVGPWCIMASQVGVAGSTKIGKGCILAGQVGVGDGLTITDGVTLAGQTGVNGNMTTPGVFQGSPPVPIKDFFRIAAASQRLPEALKRLRALEQKVEGGGK
jgi:UDP-3-O-[3-hydroxymyristoyl] glucosamine N-acyltransferase